MYLPGWRVRVPDHEVVPVTGTQVAPSVLISTWATATLSEAVPVTVTVPAGTVLFAAGDVIVIEGGVVSGVVGVAEASLESGPMPIRFDAATS